MLVPLLHNFTAYVYIWELPSFAVCSVCYYDMTACQSRIMIYDRLHIHSHRANWWISEM